ncbi:hypothetical protein AX774_g3265 [Zancudomyces culisetae]|uniref:Uncharacterized protein n=1 Tax=Zancudomyces culisetae TaxID=1213189 RepID=A0A1R1PQQ4_ZANCU|nr:hypothetical protein AX774_g3265 [Zancudomyces culisetae]|eukprot:OMH83233.1 hypothetical protein AX774_g3265 [Zancudomyces culisetae]
MARAFVSTVDRFFNECPVQSTRLTYSPVNYSVQLAYYLNLILSPRLTGGNLALYTNEMKQTLNHLIKVMMSFNLRFVQNRINETTFVFDLSP